MTSRANLEGAAFGIGPRRGLAYAVIPCSLVVVSKPSSACFATTRSPEGICLHPLPPSIRSRETSRSFEGCHYLPVPAHLPLLLTVKQRILLAQRQACDMASPSSPSVAPAPERLQISTTPPLPPLIWQGMPLDTGTKSDQASSRDLKHQKALPLLPDSHRQLEKHALRTLLTRASPPGY